VKQLLIDNYAEQHKDEVDEAPQLELTPEEESSVQDLKHGQKYQTPFYHQVMVLAKRAFMQRRNDILSWDRIILICLIAILSGLLWFRRSTTGTDRIDPLTMASFHHTGLTKKQSLPPSSLSPNAETNINDFEGFLFFCSMFWIMNTWFTSLFACTSYFPLSPSLGQLTEGTCGFAQSHLNEQCSTRNEPPAPTDCQHTSVARCLLKRPWSSFCLSFLAASPTGWYALTTTPRNGSVLTSCLLFSGQPVSKWRGFHLLPCDPLSIHAHGFWHRSADQCNGP